MKITIEGNPKEIAALVLAVQERQALKMQDYVTVQDKDGNLASTFNIPQETLDFLESIGAIWHEPWVCAVWGALCGTRSPMHFSVRYLKDTPLDEIKRGLRRGKKESDSGN